MPILSSSLLKNVTCSKIDGLQFLEELRKINPYIPFVFVTARDEPDKMLRAIQLDINNYILKPINLQNLLSILVKIVEKLYKEYLTQEKNSHIQLNKDLFWNKNNKTLIFENETIKLTKKELMFIEILMAEENMIHRVEDIICTLWNDDFSEKDYISNLKNIISRLRNKVPALNIENLYGMGYKINLITE
jgi:DNA-binding response OmpR family regulator